LVLSGPNGGVKWLNAYQRTLKRFSGVLRSEAEKTLRQAGIVRWKKWHKFILRNAREPVKKVKHLEGGMPGGGIGDCVRARGVWCCRAACLYICDSPIYFLNFLENLVIPDNDGGGASGVACDL
jgi:hypothetical protein